MRDPESQTTVAPIAPEADAQKVISEAMPVGANTSRRARELVVRARHLGRPLLAAVSISCGDIDPLTLFPPAPHRQAAGVLCRPGPDGTLDLELAWQGAAATTLVAGPRRFAEAETWARRLLADVVEDPQAPGWARPRVVVGMAFHDDALPATPTDNQPPSLGSARLLLPERLATRKVGQTWLTTLVEVSPDHDSELIEARIIAASTPPSPCRAVPLPVASVTATDDIDSWSCRVDQALAAIKNGTFDKVVLARAWKLEAPIPIPAEALARRLRASQPGCLSFALSLPEAGAFVCASPELAVSRRGLQICSGPLAGSIGRGSSPDEDRLLGQRLMASAKERAEHSLVVEAVRDALAPVATVEAPLAPTVRVLRHVQHLSTPVSGRLHQPRHIFELAGRLHPTPAVCGAPRTAALTHLRRHEPLNRGWYSGLVGWVDASGDGDLWVAIRSARLFGRHAWLLAGAGIVAGSQPESEWHETTLKLHALGDALGVAMDPSRTIA